MRVLITGITGFVGSHLAEYCLDRDIEVAGTYRWRSRMENIDRVRERIRLVECDLRDATSVRRALAEVRPDRIFHLAAQSFVPASWGAPAETMHTNIVGQVNLFEAMRDLDLEARVHIAGSSEEYGLVHPEEVPISEENPLRPLSPYAVSKVAQDLLAYQYHRSYGLRVVRTRAFNHEGPRRGEVFVTSNFAKQIAEIERGERTPVVRVGNLDAKRDFTDVRDVVHAYWLALEAGVPGDVYNIGTGRAWTIREVLETLLAFSDVKIAVEPDPSRLRPSDVELLVCDPSKFKAATGWEPQISLEVMLKDSLDHWRSHRKP